MYREFYIKYILKYIRYSLEEGPPTWRLDGTVINLSKGESKSTHFGTNLATLDVIFDHFGNFGCQLALDGTMEGQLVQKDPKVDAPRGP